MAVPPPPPYPDKESRWLTFFSCQPVGLFRLKKSSFFKFRWSLFFFFFGGGGGSAQNASAPLQKPKARPLALLSLSAPSPTWIIVATPLPFRPPEEIGYYYLNYLWWRPVSQKTCRGPVDRSDPWSWKSHVPPLMGLKFNSGTVVQTYCFSASSGHWVWT